MKPYALLCHVLFCVAATVWPGQIQASPEAEREHVLRVCAGCHCLENYISTRSRKAWELTVANMRVYAQNGAAPFTEAEGDRVVDYMATYFDDYSNLDPVKHFAKAPEPAAKADQAEAPPAAPSVAAEGSGSGAQGSAAEPERSAKPAPQEPLPAERRVEQPPEPRTANPEPTPAATVRPPSSSLPPVIREHLAHPDWKPSRALKHTAEFGGYLAIFCTLTLLASGHSRRRLGRRFRPLHIFAALGLFLGLAAHALIYLAQYGNPPVLWYWFGVVSFLVLVLAQIQGLIRKRFGRVFLRIHMTAGYCGLTLAVFHWVWAWL